LGSEELGLLRRARCPHCSTRLRIHIQKCDGSRNLQLRASKGAFGPRSMRDGFGLPCQSYLIASRRQ
jgi:hypothetical protein